MAIAAETEAPSKQKANELAVQLCIRLPDNPDHPLHDRIDHVQRMLVCWKRRLE